MPAQPNVETLLRKHLGKKAGDAVLAKVDKMIAQNKSPEEIEKVIHADVAEFIQSEVVKAVIAKIGPITPIKVKPISTGVKVKIGPISISPKINSGVQVKTGSYTKGTR
jgi:hypothetical protein